MLDPLRLAREVQEAERELARVVELERTATPVLRMRLNDLLVRMTDVARDRELWDRLADAAAEPMPAEQVEAMLDFATADLAPLLEAFGYHCPPQPSAREMVDRTVDALRAAQADDEDRRQRVEVARLDLLTFGMRVRNQVKSTPLFVGPSRLRKLARRACARARDLLPALIAVGVAGALAEHVVNELDVFFSKALEKLVERGVEPAVLVVGGLGTLWRAEARNEHLDPITLHLTALFTGISGLRSSDRGETTDPLIHARALRDVLREQAQTQPALGSAFEHLEAAFISVTRADAEECVRAVEDLEAAAWQLHAVVDLVSQDQLVSESSGVLTVLKDKVEGIANAVAKRMRLPVQEGAPGPPLTDNPQSRLDELRARLEEEARRQAANESAKMSTSEDTKGPTTPA